MPTLLLLRHGRSTANVSAVLAGRQEGVALDDRGREQAQSAGERLRGLDIASVVTSPLLRCRQTVAVALTYAGTELEPVTDERVSECDYGEWTGQKLSDLAKDPLWKTVQDTPSEVTFPGGESMLGMRDRMIEAVIEHDQRVRAEHGDHAVWVLCSHGDPIKAVLSYALGQPFDLFQRIMVDPASISVVHFGPERPFVVTSNSTAGPLSVPKAPVTDAAVGGNTGNEEE